MPEQKPTEAPPQLARAIESLNQTITDIRHYTFDLRSEVPDQDLETGLRQVVEDFKANTLIEALFIVEGTNGRGLGAERRQHIFRIASEALANVARHADAQEVRVWLRYSAGALQLSISDDGVGSPVLPDAQGQGLRNIRERVRLMDGLLDIDTAPNQGMTVTLTVPY
jgi:signal transduction histidine kinase